MKKVKLTAGQRAYIKSMTLYMDDMKQHTANILTEGRELKREKATVERRIKNNKERVHLASIQYNDAKRGLDKYRKEIGLLLLACLFMFSVKAQVVEGGVQYKDEVEATHVSGSDLILIAQTGDSLNKITLDSMLQGLGGFVRVARRNLDPGALALGNSEPDTIINPPAGFFAVLLGGYGKYTYGTTPYAALGSVAIYGATSGNRYAESGQTFFADALSWGTTFTPNSAGYITTGEPLVIQFSSDDSGGDGFFDVRLYYILVKF